MAERTVLRVAPQRDNQQATNAWRIFTQGDEFYAAPRNMIQHGKVSFHRNFNWQYRVGSAAVRLVEPIRLSQGWLLALEIAFLIDQHVLLPLEQRESNVKLVETASGYKLLVRLLLSSDVKRQNLRPPSDIGGSLLADQRLRSGATLLVTSRVMPLSDQDRALIGDVRHKLKVNFSAWPTGEVYIEEILAFFKPSKGNVIVIIPTGLETIGIEKSSTSSKPAAATQAE
jgi:hypothetical protein